MMRTSPLWSLLALSLLAQAAPAGAQDRPQNLEKVEEITGNPITVAPPAPSERQITEKREQGKVTEIKVKTGGSTYYLKPNAPAGGALPGDAVGSANRGPQWQVMEFDLSKKKKQKDEEAVVEAPVPPPPPPAAP